MAKFFENDEFEQSNTSMSEGDKSFEPYSENDNFTTSEEENALSYYMLTPEGNYVPIDFGNTTGASTSQQTEVEQNLNQNSIAISEKFLNKTPTLQRDSSLNQPLFNLLKSWNLELMFDKCLEEDIDLEILRLMKPHHLEKLLKGFTLGTQVIFEHKLTAWKESNNLTTTSNISGISLEIKEKHSYKKTTEEEILKVDVESILKETTAGKDLITSYNTSNTLNSKLRNFLVDRIADYLVNKGIKMSVLLANHISQKIVKLFPKENIATYYYKEDGKQPIGKLYQKYFNKIRSMQNAGLIKKRSTSPTTELPKKVKKLSFTFVPENNIQSNLDSIFNDNCLWADVECHWQNTRNFRVNDIQQMNSTSQIIEKWKHYKNPLGFKLIEIDFNVLHPKAKNFLHTFDLFPQKIVGIFTEEIKDQALKHILNVVQKSENFTHNGLSLSILYLMHYILPPTSKEIKIINNTKVCKKFTIQDSLNSFVIIGETVEKAEELLKKKIDELQPIQPLLIITGTVTNPEQILVYFDGIRYILHSIARALDVCFKIYHLFNLNYPTASILVWSFIQEYFYKIGQTRQNKSHPSIKILIDALEKIKE